MQPAQRFGDFEIEREIGRGAMGVVYKARDTRLHRHVAIKTIAPHIAADPSRLARLRREARTVARLNHPNIAHIHQILEQDGQLHLVLEYVEGVSLAEHIHGASGLAPNEALPLLLQIAVAIEAAHEKGVIHRDLKPDNIIVAKDGNIKMLDFGLARSLHTTGEADDETSSNVMTREGAITGTPGYMAPEQCRSEPVDERADIFAFGCIMYECLSGQRAFAGRTPADLIAATLTGEPPMSQIRATVPEHVRQLIQACLERDVERRIGTMTAVRKALERAVGQSGTATRPRKEPQPKTQPREGGVMDDLRQTLARHGWREALIRIPQTQSRAVSMCRAVGVLGASILVGFYLTGPFDKFTVLGVGVAFMVLRIFWPLVLPAERETMRFVAEVLLIAAGFIIGFSIEIGARTSSVVFFYSDEIVYWLFGAAGVVLLVGGPIHYMLNRRTLRRRAVGAWCRECGYNLVGLDERRCPECGTPFTPSALGVGSSQLQLKAGA